MLALDCCTGESLENDDLILIGALEDEFIWFICAKVQGDGTVEDMCHMGLMDGWIWYVVIIDCKILIVILLYFNNSLHSHYPQTLYGAL